MLIDIAKSAYDEEMDRQIGADPMRARDAAWLAAVNAILDEAAKECSSSQCGHAAHTGAAEAKRRVLALKKI